MLSDLQQSDVVVFAIAMFGILVSSLAIVRDHLPRDGADLDVAPESMNVPLDPAA